MGSEVLLESKANGADLLLLAGDLFHENKPSRNTLHKTFEVLRQHALGDEPVAFQVGARLLAR